MVDVDVASSSGSSSSPHHGRDVMHDDHRQGYDPAFFSPVVPTELRPAMTSDSRWFHSPMVSWMVPVQLESPIAVLTMDLNGALKLTASGHCMSSSIGGFGDLCVSYSVITT